MSEQLTMADYWWSKDGEGRIADGYQACGSWIVEHLESSGLMMILQVEEMMERFAEVDQWLGREGELDTKQKKI